MKSAALALHALLVATPAPAAVPQAPCEVSGAAGAAADVSRAETACRLARGRFRDLFGDPVPGVAVVLWDEPGYRTGIQGRRAVIYWPTGEAVDGRKGANTPPGPYDADDWGEVLPHEIAHVLLAARFFPVGFEDGEDGGYGTPFPDWLDEGVAIWAEPAASRQGRLREVRALAPARRDLRSILTAPHPAVGDARVMAMRDGGAPPEDEDLFAFYPLSLAVLGFVYDAGGGAAVLELANRLLADPRSALRAVVGLPGLPRDFAAVDAAWRRWLAEGSASSAAAR